MRAVAQKKKVLKQCSDFLSSGFNLHYVQSYHDTPSSYGCNYSYSKAPGVVAIAKINHFSLTNETTTVWIKTSIAKVSILYYVKVTCACSIPIKDTINPSIHICLNEGLIPKHHLKKIYFLLSITIWQGQFELFRATVQAIMFEAYNFVSAIRVPFHRSFSIEYSNVH